jgi:hypothetical protein
MDCKVSESNVILDVFQCVLLLLQLELHDIQIFFKNLDKSPMNCFGKLVEFFGGGNIAAHRKIGDARKEFLANFAILEEKKSQFSYHLNWRKF